MDPKLYRTLGGWVVSSDDRQVRSFVTPTDLFYVRNNLPVPDLDPDRYRLKVEGVGVRGQQGRRSLLL